MKYFFVFNPGSRNGTSENQISHIRVVLDEKKICYEYGITKSLDDAFEFSRKANLNQYDVVVAVGGDGTINKVINGFYDDKGARLSHAKFGVIYTGTSPDFCRSYNVPYAQVDRSIQVLLGGHVKKIQVGKIRLTTVINGQKQEVTRYFSCCVNIGIGASVARYANSGIRKVAGDHLGTLLALFKAFFSYRTSNLAISMDGKKEEIANVYNISIGKTRYIASGIKVHNTLSEGDGRFYILTVKNVRWVNVPHCLKVIYSGQEVVSSDTTSLTHAKDIDLYTEHEASEVEFDGDPQGFLPCQITMAQDELEIINEAN